MQVLAKIRRLAANLSLGARLMSRVFLAKVLNAQLNSCVQTTYWRCASALERTVIMKEAVSLGLKVDGTMTYSPGFRYKSSITSREFRYVLLWAAGLLLKKDAWNFPEVSLYCSALIIRYFGGQIDLVGW